MVDKRLCKRISNSGDELAGLGTMNKPTMLCSIIATLGLY